MRLHADLHEVRAVIVPRDNATLDESECVYDRLVEVVRDGAGEAELTLRCEHEGSTVGGVRLDREASDTVRCDRLVEEVNRVLVNNECDACRLSGSESLDRVIDLQDANDAVD